MITLAVDAMGGDFMPENPVKGALEALKLRDDIHIVLVGQQAAIDALDCGWFKHPRMSFVEADDVITMDDAPV
ncbi:phosphate acyltransferase, partial [Candidatus Marinamargulisbacteria bacterium]|nr:phosphate acyltransferase [Candidatus Marinamargulisbacteria bacterium]